MIKWKDIEFGRIPIEWDYLSIEKAGILVGDGNYSSKYPKQDELLSSGVPFISSNDLKNGRVISSNLRYISEVQHNKLLKGHIKQNDVLMVVRGNGVGQVALVSADFENSNINAQIAFIRCSQKSVGKFLYYLLLLYNRNGITETKVSGSAQPQITIGSLKTISLIFPSILEQESIADVLSSLDDKIDLLYQQNKTLEALAETLFRQWFVEEADETILEEEFNVVMGQSPPGNTYNENKDGIIFFQGRTDFGFRFPTPRIFCTQPSRFANKCDTLMSVRAPVGDLNYADERCCIGRGVAAIRHKNEKLHFSYTYYTLKTLKDQFDIHDNDGTIFGSINKEELLKLKCIKLDNDKINYFNNYIGKLEDKLVANCKQIKQLENLRDTLLPKLMSGAVRVN